MKEPNVDTKINALKSYVKLFIDIYTLMVKDHEES